MTKWNYFLSHVHLQTQWSIACIFFVSTITYAAGSEANPISRIDSSCQKCAAVYKADSSNYKALLMIAACTSKSGAALEMYKQITATDSVSDSIRSIAFMRIGYYYLLKEEFATARDQFSEACRFAPTAECSQIVRTCDAYLQGQKVKNSADAVADNLSSYTLQIGSFSVIENANARAKQLERMFVDVSQNVEVSKSTVADKVFFRVRVGTFPSPAEALVFGEKYLKSHKITFTVVRE